MTGYAKTTAGSPGRGSLSQALADGSSGLQEAIAAHPWVRGLADGTLHRAPLAAWAAQCALFAGMERSALTALRKRLPPGEDGAGSFLDRLIGDTEREPRQLAQLLADLGEPPPGQPSPTCLGYASYVQACAGQGLLPGLTAIYGVERFYLDTWTSVREEAADSPWSGWVDNWSSPAFRAVVDGIGAALDELAGPPSPGTLAQLAPVYQAVGRWELEFWEMAWTGQGWLAESAVPA